MKFLIAFSLLAVFGAIQKTVSLDQVRKDLQSVKTSAQAKAYVSKSGFKGDILELDEIQDSSAVAMKLFKAKPGEVIEQSSSDKSTTYLYKTLTLNESEADRVQYIFFDNRKVQKKRIDSLRNVVTKRLKGGAAFSDLARQYSMDRSGKHGGDTGWYDREMFAAGFVKTVQAHKKGDVFPVDLPAEKWYYVVRKSHDPVKRKKIVAFYVAVPSK